MTINAWLRADGRKGIRNVVAVAYLVECAHHVSREIAYPILWLASDESAFVTGNTYSCDGGMTI